MPEPITGQSEMRRTAQKALDRYDEPHHGYEHPVRSFEVARALRLLLRSEPTDATNGNQANGGQ